MDIIYPSTVYGWRPYDWYVPDPPDGPLALFGSTQTYHIPLDILRISSRLGGSGAPTNYASVRPSNDMSTLHSIANVTSDTRLLVSQGGWRWLEKLERASGYRTPTVQGGNLYTWLGLNALAVYEVHSFQYWMSENQWHMVIHCLFKVSYVKTTDSGDVFRIVNGGESREFSGTNLPQAGDQVSALVPFASELAFDETDYREFTLANPVASFNPELILRMITTDVSKAFRYDEPRLVSRDPLYRPPLPLLEGCSKAYTDACESFPRVSDNSWQNVFGATSMLWSFTFGEQLAIDATHKLASTFPKQSLPWGTTTVVSADVAEQLTLPEGIRSAWLSGRYVWKTSTLDMGTSWQWAYRRLLLEMDSIPQSVHCHGTADITDGDIKLSFRCHCAMREKGLSGVSKFCESAYRLGFEPNAYVMWDFIPYSFVVDWFVPVGDALKAKTLGDHFTPLYYEYDSLTPMDHTICYTLAYTVKSGVFGEMHVFARWYDLAPPQVDPIYYFKDDKEVSSKTAMMRLTDGIALLPNLIKG